MSEPITPESVPLPENPSLQWLRKQAKRELAELRKATPSARLADAQFALAKRHSFTSWRALKAHVDSLTLDGQLFDAVKRGDVARLTALLDAHPDKLQARDRPYEHTLLHVAARHGHLAAVDLLLARGLDANTREKGDNTYAMHWAAAAGHLDVVRRLADAGGEIVGEGDDHELGVIGWATCWDGGDDVAHRAVADFLVSRGARHHVFSAIALSLADEVRKLVAADPSVLATRMSRNENHMLPLHFAVRQGRPEMVALLLELGADPLALDGNGASVAQYATTPDGDRPVMERIRTSGSGGGPLELVAALALGDWTAAEGLLQGGSNTAHGALHLMAKRGDVAAVRFLLEHGADPNALWSHWDSDLTALHLAVMQNHVEVARALTAAGARSDIRDTKHDADAVGWADFFGRTEILKILQGG